jgi:hypothetical protein
VVVDTATSIGGLKLPKTRAGVRVVPLIGDAKSRLLRRIERCNLSGDDFVFHQQRPVDKTKPMKKWKIKIKAISAFTRSRTPNSRQQLTGVLPPTSLVRRQTII